MPHSQYQLPSHVHTFDQHPECSRGPDWTRPAKPRSAAQSPRQLHPLKDPKLDCCQKGGDEEKGGPNELDGLIKCEVQVKSDFVPNSTAAADSAENGSAPNKPKPAPCRCYQCPPEEMRKTRADRGPTGGGGDISNAEGWSPDESDELCCDSPSCFTCHGNCALAKPGGYDFPPPAGCKCRGHCHVACCNECKLKKERNWPSIRCINPHRNRPCLPKLHNDPCRSCNDPCCEPPQLWKNDPAPEHTPESFRIISLLCNPESSKPVVESDLLGYPDSRMADSVRICDRYHPVQSVRNYKHACPGPCPCNISAPIQCPETCSPYCPQNTCNPGFVAYPTTPNAQVMNPQWSMPGCSPCRPYGPCDPIRMGSAWPCSPYDPCNRCGANGPMGPSCVNAPCQPCTSCGSWGPIPNFPCYDMTYGSQGQPKERLAGGGILPKQVSEERMSSGGGGKQSPTQRFASGAEVPCTGPPFCGPQSLPKPPQGPPWGQVRPQGYLAGPSTNFSYVTGPCNTGAPCYEPCDPGKPVIPCNPVNRCRRACCPVCGPPGRQCYTPTRCYSNKPTCPMICAPPVQYTRSQRWTDCRPKVVEEEVSTTCKNWRENFYPQCYSVCCSNQYGCCDPCPQLLTEEQLSMFRRCIEHPQPWYNPCNPCDPCGAVVPCGTGIPFPPCAHQRSQSPARSNADICDVPEDEVGMTRDDPEIIVCPPGTYRLRSPGRPPLEGAQVCAQGTAKFKGVREQDPPRDWEMHRRTAVKDLMDPKIPQACYDSSVCAPLGYPRAQTRNPNLPPCPPCPDPNKPPQPPGCAKDTQSKPSCSKD